MVPEIKTVEDLNAFLMKEVTGGLTPEEYVRKWLFGKSIHSRNMLVNLNAREIRKMKSFLRTQQNNRCAICGRPQEEQTRPMVLDHNRHTGEVRGLLCTSCNTGLERFDDSIPELLSAILYLLKNKVKV